MSRRITVCVLAASVALIATQASADQKLIRASAAIVDIPGVIYAENGMVPVYPYWRHDPAWKLCQIGSRNRGRHHHYYYCGPYSYHPYGAYGYRPNGTYVGYRSPPVYVLAPNAKIISVVPEAVSINAKIISIDSNDARIFPK